MRIVSHQHGADATVGSLNIYEVASRTNQSFELPGRPGFAKPSSIHAIGDEPVCLTPHPMSFSISMMCSPGAIWTTVFAGAFDMERCPACGRGTLRIIAAITQGDVIRKILRHLKLATDPPPIAPARACQATFAWASP